MSEKKKYFVLNVERKEKELRMIDEKKLIKKLENIQVVCGRFKGNLEEF